MVILVILAVGGFFIFSTPAVKLTANPITIKIGQKVQLVWSSTRSSRCSVISPSHWIGFTKSSAVQSVFPTSNTTYKISCNGLLGAKVASVEVRVSGNHNQLFGYSTHIGSQSDPNQYLNFAKNSNATTVRDDSQFKWARVEPARGKFYWAASDKVVEESANAGLHVLLLTDKTPSWTNISDSASFGSFITQLVSRYGPGGKFWVANPNVPQVYPAGIEIWNEENLNQISPSTYVAMLKAAYSAVRSIYPAPDGIKTMPVILGGLGAKGGYNDANCDGSADTPISNSGHYNNLNYLEDIYQNGGEGYFDAVGWHLYNFGNGAVASQMLAYNYCSPWSQLNATNPSVLSLMQQYGDASKKIWVTEAGAPTCQIHNTSFYSCVSEAEQAKLATAEVSAWKSYPWAGNFYWYDLRNDNGGISTSDKEQHFGVVRGSQNSIDNGGPNSPKPSYYALKKSYSQ